MSKEKITVQKALLASMFGMTLMAIMSFFIMIEHIDLAYKQGFEDGIKSLQKARQ